MNVDLTQEYFTRDLTEAEEELLAQEIASSPESALRLADQAKAFYAATGLPRPDWDSRGKGAGSSGTFLGMVLGALLLGGACWMACHHGFDSLFPSKGPVHNDDLYSSLPDNDARSARSAQNMQDTRPRVPDPGRSIAPLVSASTSAAAVQEPPDPMVRTRTHGQVRPRSYMPGEKYGGLSVVVNQRSAGLVTVRVLDGRQNEVRLLYAGMLQAGVWSFQWEGRMQDGSPAAPGLYTVETQSGRTILKDQVRVGQE